MKPKKITCELTPETLRLLYETCKLSTNEIASVFGVSHGCIHKRLTRCAIPRRSQQEGCLLAMFKAAPNERRHLSVGAKYISNQGYVVLYRPWHPNAMESGGVYEHVVVMTEHLGRPLRDGEVIHHINCIKTDNRLENLQLMTQSEHVTLHNKLRREQKRKEQAATCEGSSPSTNPSGEPSTK